MEDQDVKVTPIPLDERPTFIPRNDFVLVLPDTQAQRSSLYLPNHAVGTPERGVVLAVGPGLFDQNGRRIPITDLEPGTRVEFRLTGEVARIAAPVAVAEDGKVVTSEMLLIPQWMICAAVEEPTAEIIDPPEPTAEELAAAYKE